MKWLFIVFALIMFIFMMYAYFNDNIKLLILNATIFIQSWIGFAYLDLKDKE